MIFDPTIKLQIWEHREAGRRQMSVEEFRNLHYRQTQNNDPSSTSKRNTTTVTTELPPELITVFTVIFWVTMSFSVVFPILDYLGVLLSYISSELAPAILPVGGTAVVLGLAYSMFRLKNNHLYLYSLSILSMSAIIAFFTLYDLQSVQMKEFISLLSAAIGAVEGFSSFDKSKEQET